jgi:branched-chain amino acid transport system ATP-binding protein
VLEVRGLRSGYKRSTVLQGVDLDVPEGQVLGLLGRNGVGKSTLINTLMGLVTPSAGTVRLDGVDLAGRRPDVVARAGVALVPQGRRVWAPLSVTEHLDLAARRGRGRGPWDTGRVLDLLPRLGERRRHAAGQLSGGEQQMLAIARALLTNPRLVLMDEPSDGLAPAVVDQIGGAIARMKAEGVTLVVVEQDLHLAFAVADEIAVMDKGQVVHRSPTLEFRRDSSVAHRLLGVS